MSTKTLLASSSHINDRHLFRSHSNETTKTRFVSKNRLSHVSSILTKRKFSSKSMNQYDKTIYKFPTNTIERRSCSYDPDRYYFPPNNFNRYPRSGSKIEQRSIAFMEDISTLISDAPYLFSRTTDTQKYPSTISTFIHPESK